MTSPRRVGSEQLFSPLKSRDFMLARYTADVGPSQASYAMPWTSPTQGTAGVGVLYASPGFLGVGWQVLVLDDGSLLQEDDMRSDESRDASCSNFGDVIVFVERGERKNPHPDLPRYFGRIVLRVGTSVWTHLGLMPHLAWPRYVELDEGHFYYPEDLEKSWSSTEQEHVFAPSVCTTGSKSDSLVLWNRGYRYADGSRQSLIRGCVVPGDYRDGQPLNKFTLESTSTTSDRFNANLHLFDWMVDVGTASTEELMNTIGLVKCTEDGLIDFRVFDTQSGKLDPNAMYSMQWSPEPGLDPAGGRLGSFLPVVAWIGRSSGDVHVAIVPRRPNGFYGSTLSMGTIRCVANDPPGRPGNRRPSVARVNLHTPPSYDGVVIA